MKLKGLHFADVAEFQEAVTDELRRSKKRNFWQLFRNCKTAQKPIHMYANGTYLDKKVMCLRFKKISPKTIGPHSVTGPLKIRQKVMENVHFAIPLFCGNALTRLNKAV